MALRKLVKDAIKAVEDINSDMSVPDTRTLSDLEEVQSVTEGMIEGLKEQIKNREKKEGRQ